MKRSHLDFDTYLEQALKKPGVKREYEKLQPEFALIGALIRARQEQGLTQKELARKMGTTQSVVARIESGNANPSLRSLQKLATALSAQLEVRLVVD